MLIFLFSLADHFLGLDDNVPVGVLDLAVVLLLLVSHRAYLYFFLLILTVRIFTSRRDLALDFAVFFRDATETLGPSLKFGCVRRPRA
jgi:hypothetical protein